MLDSSVSLAQGLDQVNRHLDCRSRPPHAHANPDQSLIPTESIACTACTAGSCSSDHHQRRFSETSSETPSLPPSRPVLSTSTSSTSLYTLSPVSSSTVLAPPTTPAPSHSPPGSPRHSTFHVDAGSPKIRSPLRNSVTFADGPDGLQLYIADSNSALKPPVQLGHRRWSSVDMALTGDKRPRGSIKPADSPAIATTSPTMSQASDGSPISRWFSRGSSTTDAATPRTTRSASSTPKIGSPASRFGLFSSSNPKDVSNFSVSVPQHDQLMNLDIEAALFPGGYPSDKSAFSPAAFKNLHMNAAGLLNKFQIAYQQRTIDYQELKAVREAQDEERDEVDTRVHHLKMQLEDMAQKAAEREENMASLLQELALEKKARAEEQAARDKCVVSSGTSTVSEDLGVDEDRQRSKGNWRKSTATAKSDLSLDTDEDSIDEASIFSRSRSPTIATTMSETSPIPQQKPVMLEPPRPSRSSTPQLSTFQKLFKGYSPDVSLEPTSSCRNCQGQDTSVAWDTVSLLKDENKGLKVRVEELETAVENALDVVNGIGL